ncbi:MAG: phosphoribosylformylglycinamidine cyclo-ligase [Planctomycetes bacterium]|nr:phosphoribosylformylglycinamidine cyclo-ligase [Planctomycetota bacterium]
MAKSSAAATYEQSGVSFDRKETFLGALLSWVKRTERFPAAGQRPLIPNGYYASVLDVGLPIGIALTTDGVGSKILVAEAAGDFSGLGIDLIAMNVNDLLCVGALPTALVDYIAMEAPPASVGAALGKSLFEGAKQAGISIPGGELAQLPDMIRGHNAGQGFDLAAAAIGTVAREHVSNGQGIQPGDVLIGIESNGVHSNGFTLVREICFKRRKLKVDRIVPEFGRTLGAELLLPTTIYVPQFRALAAAGLRPRAAMHITGGGYLNLLRAATPDISFVIDTPPAITPVFTFLQQQGGVTDEEMHRVFNLGIGMVLVVEAAKVDATLATLKKRSWKKASAIGRVEAGGGKGGRGKCVRFPGRGLIGRGITFTRE